MGTSRQEIDKWFDEGIAQGATHMLVVCDTYDHDDYPVYVMPGQDPRKRAEPRMLGEMQRLMEVYKLDPIKKVEQLNARRVFNYD